MQQSVAEWTRYSPPKARAFGHPATIGDPGKAWGQLAHFFERHTVCGEMLFMSLTIDAREPCWTPASLQLALDSLTAANGPPRELSSGMHLWGGDCQDRVTPDTLQLVLQVASRTPWMKVHRSQFLRLHFCIDFFWRDGSESQVPPARFVTAWTPRYAYSNLGVTISDRLFVQPSFWFPYPWGSSSLRALLTEISPSLPFTFRADYFKRALLNKRGDAFRLLRTVPRS